jgi:membrane associated rhomboid family serine protease
MFGSMLENVWGPKRFLFFYLFCGLGAAAVQIGATGFSIMHIHDMLNAFLSHPTPGSFDTLIGKFSDYLSPDGMNEASTYSSAFSANPAMSGQSIEFAKTITQGVIDTIKNIPTLGASGAIFGLLVAFGYLFPNTELYIMFIPIPVKAKYVVIGYAALELFFGFSGYEPGVAHFAHLGGALFGFLLVYYWNKTGKRFY